MSTEAIGYSNYSGLSSLQYGTSSQTTTQQTTTATSSQSSKFPTTSQIRAEVDAYLKDIPKGADGKLSFQDIEDYRDKLGDAWDEAVKADLAKLGVDVSDKFPLEYDSSTGKVSVSSKHPDKKIIDKYFEDNPDKVEEFQKIIQLGKMTQLSKSTLSSQELRKNIQQESMAWWYEDNSDPTTWFSNGGGLLGLGQGLTNYTGIDIKV